MWWILVLRMHPQCVCVRVVASRKPSPPSSGLAGKRQHLYTSSHKQSIAFCLNNVLLFGNGQAQKVVRMVVKMRTVGGRRWDGVRRQAEEDRNVAWKVEVRIAGDEREVNDRKRKPQRTHPF